MICYLEKKKKATKLVIEVGLGKVRVQSSIEVFKTNVELSGNLI